MSIYNEFCNQCLIVYSNGKILPVNIQYISRVVPGHWNKFISVLVKIVHYIFNIMPVWTSIGIFACSLFTRGNVGVLRIDFASKLTDFWKMDLRTLVSAFSVDLIKMTVYGDVSGFTEASVLDRSSVAYFCLTSSGKSGDIRRIHVSTIKFSTVGVTSPSTWARDHDDLLVLSLLKDPPRSLKDVDKASLGSSLIRSKFKNVIQ